MKKIMFNDKYGLTKAVLEGKKTMTRRIIEGEFEKVSVYNANCNDYFIAETKEGDTEEIKPRYQVGETVAVAQPYKDAIHPLDWVNKELYEDTAAWKNKMFVLPELMPYRIRITEIKLERLQDISEEDAMREGVFNYDKPPLHHEADMFAPWAPYVRPYKWDSNNLVYRCTARYAFAYLIDKISGGGTWNRNPYVFVYTFELINN